MFQTRFLRGAVAGLACAAIFACAPDGAVTDVSGRDAWRMAPEGDLNAFFDCLKGEGITLVSAHRGGPAPGFPENAIETFERTLSLAPVLIETDIAASKDGVLYLMHDDTLDRATDGEGAVNDRGWNEISALRLVDEYGAKTPFSPTRFADALAWAEGRAILQLDIKPSARYADVAREIEKQGAQRRVLIIATTLAKAQKLHELLPDTMISLDLNSMSDLNRAVAGGVPAERLLGFTGTEAPRPRLFDVLAERDVEVVFGTLGRPHSIDAAIAASGDDDQYAELAASGVDVIATDRPEAAHVALAAAGRGARDGVCGVSFGP